MKKNVRMILAGFAAVILVIFGIVYATMPVELGTFTVMPKDASDYFIETGYVKDSEIMEVYSVISGKVLNVNFKENDYVNKGDIICTIDSQSYDYEIMRLESVKKSYEAQIGNVRFEEERRKESLISNKSSLLGEYEALAAQEENNAHLKLTQEELKAEQIRLQKILVAQNELNYETAKEDSARAEVLYNAGSISRKEYDDILLYENSMLNAFEAVKAELDIIEKGIVEYSPQGYFEGMKESLNAQISGINASLSKDYSATMIDYYTALIGETDAAISLLKEQKGDAHVIAPVSGVIDRLYAKNANVVNSQMPLALIRTENALKAEVYVSTKDIGELYLGQEVQMILKNRQEDMVFSGEIERIEDYASVRVSALGVEERSVMVTIAPKTEAESFIKPGYDVDIKFTTFFEKDALSVPKTAVFSNGGKDALWLVENGKLAIKEVELGAELRTEYIIKAGVRQGDAVIKNANSQELKEGRRVK